MRDARVGGRGSAGRARNGRPINSSNPGEGGRGVSRVSNGVLRPCFAVHMMYQVNLSFHVCPIHVVV